MRVFPLQILRFLVYTRTSKLKNSHSKKQEREPIGLNSVSLSNHLEDTDFGVCLEVRGQARYDIVREKSGLEVRSGVFSAVEAVQHLYILVAYEQVFGQCARDGVEERLTIVEIHFCGVCTVAFFNLHCDLKIRFNFCHSGLFLVC